jgi:transcriptional regulator, propionate catabolism operon regulatory protein
MIRIAVIGHPLLISLLHNLDYAPPGVSIQGIHAILDEAVVRAKQLEAKGEVDVFVTSGINARLLAKTITKPLVEIRTTGFDILKTIKMAKRHARRVAIFTYAEQIAYLQEILDILTVEITPIIYDNLPDVERSMDALFNEGVRTVIGTGNVVTSAQRRGMNGIFIFSDDSLKRALDTAIQIGVLNRAEARKAEELRAILDFAYGGVLATDQQGVINLFNPSAEKITGIPKEKALGVPIAQLFPRTRIAGVLKSGKPELSQIQPVGDRNVLTNTIPILLNNVVTGVVITFQDVTTIQEAESKIRKDIFSPGFVAKTTLDDILGRSEVICRARTDAFRYAQSDATVVIFGESGTGKELFARGIHNASVRRKKPFVAINCSSFPESLLESELFGYEEGAFTGARKGGKHGFFELAHGGTIFLDEIAEIPLSLQTRLLRIVEERDLVRIGGESILHVDIRVIAATNKDLWGMVEKGLFRADLCYRLSVLELRIPPLRERLDDIPLLAGTVLRGLRPDLSADTIALIAEWPLFRSYDWPGNIRELKNFLERFSVLFNPGEDPIALIAVLFAEKNANASGRLSFSHAGIPLSRTREAERLGISRTTLWRRRKRKDAGRASETDPGHS